MIMPKKPSDTDNNVGQKKTVGVRFKQAIESNDLKKIEQIIQNEPIDINQYAKEIKDYWILWAVSQEKFGVVKLLLTNNAELNHTLPIGHPCAGQTIMHALLIYCIDGNQVALIKMIITGDDKEHFLTLEDLKYLA